MALLFIANDADTLTTNASIHGFGFAFNSELLLTGNAAQHHELRFYLGICLVKVPKAIGDSLGKANIRTKDWEDSEWYKFRDVVTQGAEVWNNRFWLIPPDSYKELSWPLPPHEWTHRPNIKCSLEVNFFASPGEAHKTINMVRLDDSYYTRNPLRSQAGTKIGMWDSMDGMPIVFDVPDASGVTRHYSQVPVAHEIGHLIGQHHIGVMKKTTLCLRAMDPSRPPTLVAGGVVYSPEDSAECYGGDTPSLANNIMGMGMAFDVVNAQPWKDRTAVHTDTNSEDWKVSMKNVLPAVRKRR
jgi:hypothetical protein